MGKEKKSKDKDSAKRKDYSIDEKTSSPTSDKKRPLKLQTDFNRWILEKESKNLPYYMRGVNIYALNDEVDNKIKKTAGKKFAIGEKVKGRADNYKVVKVLGRCTYVVKSSTSGNQCVMKTQATVHSLDEPLLMREFFFHENARKDRTPLQRSHFLKCIDQIKLSSPTDTVNMLYAVFMPKAKFTLSEVRSKKLGGEFSTQTAIRLCMMTLQCIHDVHRNCYVHRDIQPKNFFVGSSDKNGVSSILIGGLSYSFDVLERDTKKGLPSSRKLANTRFLHSGFQPRDYHIRQSIVTFSADLESWIFMCYDFFNSKALAWNTLKLGGQREYYNQKEAFFLGGFDHYFRELGIPPLLNCIRRKIFLLTPGESVDYVSLASMIMQLAKENNVDWNALYEWQDNYKEDKRSKASIAETQDEDETGVAKSAPSKAKKPSKKARLSKSESVDMDDDEAVEQVRLQAKLLKKGQKSKPVVTPKKKPKIDNQEEEGEPADGPIPKPAVTPKKKKPTKKVENPEEEEPVAVTPKKKPTKPNANQQEEEPVAVTPKKKPTKPNANQEEEEPVAVTPKKKPAKPNDNQEEEADPVAVTPKKKPAKPINNLDNETNSTGSNELSKPTAVLKPEKKPSDKKVDNQAKSEESAVKEAPKAASEKKTSDEKENNEKKVTENAVNEQALPPLNVAKPPEPPQTKKPEESNAKSDYFELPK